METGWTRFSTSDGIGEWDLVTLSIEWVKVDVSRRAWFSQANHVFSRLGINSNHEDYVLTHGCEFHLKFFPTNPTSAAGYLFICPREDLRAGLSSFRWPDCVAYWSHDPEGVERLGRDEATRLGFPAVHLQIKIQASRWNDHIYTGLRKFHEGKGFNPESQDVAHHLGYPLFEVYNLPAPFAFSAAHLISVYCYNTEIQFPVEGEETNTDDDAESETPHP
ncbi:hypothetical protein C8R44DRAFT_723426 [Mycena epipterygia]|nr:hypothetical protein C8R44DRAFT_723426 [Mycena epipterygia]